MKVEHYGKLPEKQAETPAPPWWLGKRAECPKCHTLVTLTLGDAPANLDAFQLKCPNVGCGGYIQVRPLFDRSGRIW